MGRSEAAAAALRTLRLEAGLSQEQLAARCGVSDRTLRALETGSGRRPRADTLVLVADALELTGSVRAEFLDVWGPGPRTVADLVGEGLDDEIGEEFGRQRRLLQELVVANRTVVDEHRRIVSTRIRRTFQVVGPGLDAFLTLRGYPSATLDPDRVRVTDCENLAVEAIVQLPAVHGMAVRTTLREPLQVGETYSLAYTIDYSDAYLAEVGDPLWDTEDEVWGLPSPLRSLAVEVCLPERDLPTSLWYVSSDVLGQPGRRVRPLRPSAFGVAGLHLSPAAAGSHGIAWGWDTADARS